MTSRGVDRAEEQLRDTVSVVRPLLREGQGLGHRWQTRPGRFPVSCRMLYRYIEAAAFDIGSIELPKKVKYRPRKKQRAAKAPFRPNPCGRTYTDFCEPPSDEQANAVETGCTGPLGAAAGRS